MSPFTTAHEKSVCEAKLRAFSSCLMIIQHDFPTWHVCLGVVFCAFLGKWDQAGQSRRILVCRQCYFHCLSLPAQKEGLLTSLCYSSTVLELGLTAWEAAWAEFILHLQVGQLPGDRFISSQTWEFTKPSQQNPWLQIQYLQVGRAEIQQPFPESSEALA